MWFETVDQRKVNANSRTCQSPPLISPRDPCQITTRFASCAGWSNMIENEAFWCNPAMHPALATRASSFMESSAASPMRLQLRLQRWQVQCPCWQVRCRLVGTPPVLSCHASCNQSKLQ
jgi:hypothetical protein